MKITRCHKKSFGPLKYKTKRWPQLTYTPSVFLMQVSKHNFVCVSNNSFSHINTSNLNKTNSQQLVP